MIRDKMILSLIILTLDCCIDAQWNYFRKTITTAKIFSGKTILGKTIESIGAEANGFAPNRYAFRFGCGWVRAGKLGYICVH